MVTINLSKWINRVAASTDNSQGQAREPCGGLSHLPGTGVRDNLQG
jgi:hypothetical protein